MINTTKIQSSLTTKLEKMQENGARNLIQTLWWMPKLYTKN